MSSRYKLGKETAASNGLVERHYRGVCKHGRGYGVRVTNPGKRTGIWLGTFDTPEEAALAYDSAARQLQGNRAKTNLPNPNKLSPAAALPPEALELSLSSYSSGGQTATGTMSMYHPLARLPTEALELRLSSYSSVGSRSDKQ